MKRSKHSLSQYRLTSLNQGVLFPVACEEVLPGDSFRWQSAALLRVSPLVSPVMHPVHACIHHWYVPNRLLWTNWEPFITGRDTALVVPTLGVVNAGNPPHSYLARALGIGADTASLTANALPFRAYNFIWNEFYRDQNLDTKAVERRGDSGDVGADYALLNCRWEKDYYTTARPNPQQGSGVESVPLTLSGTAPVTGIGKGTGNFTVAGVAVRESGGTTPTYANASQLWDPGADQATYLKGTAATSGFPDVRVNLSGVTVPAGISINDWRQSMAMQRIREHRNKFGERYKDYLAFLGVHSSDSRLDRPEYLGGGKQTISFSEVLSTADTASGGTGAPVGEMAGHGIAALRTRPFRRFFEEHGYVISLLFLRPVSVYMNRVPRHFLRRDYEHYWQKELEMMGDQTITNAEIYGDSGTPSTTFGYQNRYDEYRHGESSISGEFRNVLNYWHMGRIFSSQPALNASFVACDPTDRIYASNTTDEIYAMVSHRISARRLVSKRARA